MRLNAILLTAAICAVPFTASAADDAPKTTGAQNTAVRIKPRFWYHLIALPIYALAADNAHEGSHALMALALGHEVLRYEPYPHFTDLGDGQKRFVFGATMMSGGMVPHEEALMLIAPSITDLTLFTAADLTLSFTDPDAWYAPVLWFSCLLWPLIDWTFHMNAPGATSDVTRFAKIVGVDRVALAVAGDMVALTMLWRLTHHFIRIFLVGVPMPGREIGNRGSGSGTGDGKNGVAAVLESLTVAPALSQNFTGLGLTGQF